METEPISRGAEKQKDAAYGSIEDAAGKLEHAGIEKTSTDCGWGDDVLDNSGDKAVETVEKSYERFQLMGIFLVTIMLGPLNFVLYKVSYAAYGEDKAFFVSNMVNFQYVIFGQFFLWWGYYHNQIDLAINNYSQHGKIRVMAFLDALAGFLAAMGAAYTSGATQQLLNQSLIPFTMLCGYLFLGRAPSFLQVTGSGIIFLGAGIVLLPHLLSTPLGGSMQTLALMASVIYASSNLPLSFSYAYKEYGFKNLKVHVIYLTQWVSIYQLLWGFLLLPLQAIPGLGSTNGLTIAESVHALKEGWKCFLHENETCRERNAMGLLTAYILVNFAFNLMGLYLVKHGSSVLNAISYAIILPLTVISFTLPVLGNYQESFNWDTIVGLAVVLVGFGVWRSDALDTEEDEGTSVASTPAVTPQDTPVATPSATPVQQALIDKRQAAEKLKQLRRTRSASKSRKGQTRHLFSPVKRRDEDDERASFQERTIVLSPMMTTTHKRYKSEDDLNSLMIEVSPGENADYDMEMAPLKQQQQQQQP